MKIDSVYQENLTSRLLQVMGSPYVDPADSPASKEEAYGLYEHAKKNKIGYTYLDSLKSRGMLGTLGLEALYEEEKGNHDTQYLTARRIADVLNRNDASYAIFKSIMPFPATPNDVDIIHFGTQDEFDDLVKVLLKDNYELTAGEVDSGQLNFHDARECTHFAKGKKDVYDIDIYQRITANQIIYLNKAKVARHSTSLDLAGVEAKVLSPEAELVTIVIHSIVPEMIFTLFVYYATLHYAKLMDEESAARLARIAKENGALYPMRAHFTLVAELHRTAHGFVPGPIEMVLDRIGRQGSETGYFRKNGMKMPYRYGWYSIFRIFIEKSADPEFLVSVVHQMFCMMNPRVAKYVIQNIIWRRSRETY